MLINSFLYIFITLMVIIFFTRLITSYKKNKGKEVPNFLFFPFYCLIMALILGFFFLPRVHIVSDDDYVKRILIGTYSTKLNAGDDDEVYITDNCVINNSSRTLYVETIRYIYSSGYSGLYKVEEIPSYSVYYSNIDYAFETPPETIRTNVLVKDSSTKKWLREKSFYEGYEDE